MVHARPLAAPVPPPRAGWRARLMARIDREFPTRPEPDAGEEDREPRDDDAPSRPTKRST